MEERRAAGWLCLLLPTSGEIYTLQHGFGTSRVTWLRVGRGGDEDVITSVFQISGSVESPAVYPVSSERGKNLSASPSEVPSRQWLMSEISMVTFDQRSANSLISRAIINRANHIDSPLILTQENVGLGKRRKKRKEGQGARREAGLGLE